MTTKRFIKKYKLTDLIEKTAHEARATNLNGNQAVEILRRRLSSKLGSEIKTSFAELLFIA